MKNLITSISMMLILSCASAQWTWQNPLPQGNTLLSVFFTGANTGYAVGHFGTILKTTDRGKPWIDQSPSTSETIISIFFIDDTVGYATGYKEVYLKLLMVDTIGSVCPPGPIIV